MAKEKKNLLIYACLAAWLFLALSENRADYDTWGLLAFGRAFWEGPGFLFRDIFSFGPTKTPWIFHEWLAGVLTYPLYAAFGGPGLQIWKMLLGAGAGVLVFATARKRGGSAFFALACLVLSGHLLFSGMMPLRPRLFTLLFLAATLFLLQEADRKESPRHLYGLPALFLFWANLHGGFMAGLGAVFLYALGRLISKKPGGPFFAAFLASAAATLVNPYGVRLWTAILGHAAAPQAEILEWYSLPRALAQGEFTASAAVFGLLAASLVILAVLRALKDPVAWLILCAFAALSVVNVRHLPLFGLAFAVYVPPALSGLKAMEKTKRQKALAAGLAVVLVSASPVPALGLFRQGLHVAYPRIFGSPFMMRVPPCSAPGAEAPCYPLRAAAYLKQSGFTGNLVPHYDWGAFLLFTLYPDWRVAMDGRAETVYPDEYRREYFDFIYARENGMAFLDRHTPDVLLLKTQSPPCAQLEKDPHWKRVYQDPAATVFVSAKHWRLLTTPQ